MESQTADQSLAGVWSLYLAVYPSIYSNTWSDTLCRVSHCLRSMIRSNIGVEDVGFLRNGVKCEVMHLECFPVFRCVG